MYSCVPAFTLFSGRINRFQWDGCDVASLHGVVMLLKRLDFNRTGNEVSKMAASIQVYQVQIRWLAHWALLGIEQWRVFNYVPVYNHLTSLICRAIRTIIQIFISLILKAQLYRIETNIITRKLEYEQCSSTMLHHLLNLFKIQWQPIDDEI